MEKKEIILKVKVQRTLAIIALLADSIWNILCFLGIRPRQQFLYGTYALIAFFFSFFLLKLIIPEIKIEKSAYWKHLSRQEKIQALLMIVAMFFWIATYFLCMI